MRLYDGAPLYREVIVGMARSGYRLATIDPGFEDARTGEMLQFDGIFVTDGRPGDDTLASRSPPGGS